MLSCTGSVITGVNPLTLLRVERLNLSYDGGNPRSLPLFRDQLERELNVVLAWQEELLLSIERRCSSLIQEKDNFKAP